MKIAFAGKGGTGKTTLCAWTADYLARLGHTVWMIDADTTLSLGRASGLAEADLPLALAEQHDLIMERIGKGLISLMPRVDDLPERLSVPVPVCGPALPGCTPGEKRLLVMGGVGLAGGGCACEANALLKALLAHCISERGGWLLVDLEAGVEHLGRGTVASVDGLVLLAEPGLRSLEAAARAGSMAADLGLTRQVLMVNRLQQEQLHSLPGQVPDLEGLPAARLGMPRLPELEARMFADASVTGLQDWQAVDAVLAAMIAALQ